MTFNTIGFVGLGLIGGSVAKSIKRVHPEITIVGYNRNQEVLKEAVRDGVIDITSDDSLEAFRECDLIFLCVPVVTALDFMDRLRDIKKEGADDSVPSFCVCESRLSRRCSLRRHPLRNGRQWMTG